MQQVLVTGASGFVGRSLVARLAQEGRFLVRAASRQDGAHWPSGVVAVRVGDLTPDADWQEALCGRGRGDGGIDVVVHLAARVHVMKDLATEPLAEFRRVNVDGTLHLARQAASAGVRRFVFISTIKVNGEETQAGHPFRADSVPAPRDPYGISKWEAEQGLFRLAEKSGMEVVVIRPPLVYGPGVKANFADMICWVQKGVPLPLGAVRDNRRSLVALDNLVDLIVTSIDHPAAANQVFLAGDDQDLSTAVLLEQVAAAMGGPARLLPVPVSMLMAGAALLGRRDLAQRLLGSLQVDIGKTREMLNWTPPLSVEEGIRRAVAAGLDKG